MGQVGRAILCTLLLGAMLLSGCAGGGDGDGGDTSSTTGGNTTTNRPPGQGPTITGTNNPGATTSSPPGSNQAPAPSFSASIQNGQIPLNVTFTVGGTDPDGDKLSFTLTFGDGSADTGKADLASGFSEPVDHQYATAGEFNATLTLRDAKGASNSQYLVINVTEALGATGVTYQCTAAPGGSIGGVTGPNIVTVSGCTLTTTTTTVAYLGDEVPDNCNVVYDEDGDGLSDGTPAAGETYGPDVAFFAGCGPLNPQGQIKITLSA